MHLPFNCRVHSPWNPLSEDMLHCPADPILTGSTWGPTVVPLHLWMTRKLTLTAPAVLVSLECEKKHSPCLPVWNRRVIVPLISTFLPSESPLNRTLWHILLGAALWLVNVRDISKLALVTQYPNELPLLHNFSFIKGLAEPWYRPIKWVLLN